MKKSRILIVEDETDVLDANRLYLENEGYDVICAINLKEAQNAIWEYPPDLILLDVLLPDGSGYDFCKKIRTVTAAPIIFLTCMDSNEQIVNGFSLGADDYITKPYNMDILSARIAARLRTSNSGNGIISLPPLKIDLHTGKVWNGDEEILLSTKELQLLAFFVRNIGLEFLPEEIYQNVWGEVPVHEISNTIRVHISNLRSKLQLDDRAPFEICLTPNKGYLFLRNEAV